MSIVPLFIFIASLSVFFILQALYWLAKYRKDKKNEILFQRLGANENEIDVDDGLFREEIEGTGRQALVRLLKAAGEEGSLNDLFQKVLLYATGGFLIGLAVFKAMWTAVFLALFGPLFLYMRLVSKKEKRTIKIEQQLPEALEMMIISLRAGQSLEQAFALNARELPSPIGDEFQHISEEVRLGLAMEEALKSMTLRIDQAKTVKTFVVSVLVLRQTGGNLIEVLESLIETMRQQSQYEHKLKSMTAESRSNARTLGALPPVFLAITLSTSPDYMSQITSHPTGVFMLILSASLYILGFLWVRRLVRVRH
jgi:tight adherence protein B